MILIIYSPVGEVFRFTAPSPYLLAIIATILVSYFILLELAKKPFFRRHRLGGPSPRVLIEVKKLWEKRSNNEKA